MPTTLLWPWVMMLGALILGQLRKKAMPYRQVPLAAWPPVLARDLEAAQGVWPCHCLAPHRMPLLSSWHPPAALNLCQ